MNRRDRFIAELRDEARRKGLSFRAETWRGKGGHMNLLKLVGTHEQKEKWLKPIVEDRKSVV